MTTESAKKTLRIALNDDTLPASSLLSFDQIRSVAKAAVDCGIRRFELCGAEPLRREDIPILVMMLSSLTILEDMTLTTDGILLPRWAKALRGAGVHSVTVKLDTFDPVKYRMMNGGGDLTAVLTGIRTLTEVGFPPAVLEVRLIRGLNDDELPSLIRLTRMTGISLRLMELTPEEAAAFGPDAHMTCADALERLPELIRSEEHPSVYHLDGAAGTVTLIPCGRRDDGCAVLSAAGMLSAGTICKNVLSMSAEELHSFFKEVTA